MTTPPRTSEEANHQRLYCHKWRISTWRQPLQPWPSAESRTHRWAPGPRHLDSHRGKTPGTSGPLTLWLCCSWNKLLIRLAGGELAPRLSLVSPKVFSPFCHRWSFRSLPLSPLACSVGDTSLAAQSSTWLHRYYLNWTKLDNAITKFNNEMHSADKLSVKSCHFTLLTQFAYFDIVQCFVTICIVKSAI